MSSQPQEPPFWLVWCEDGGAPTVKHPDPETAENEARRLAKLNAGKRFVVLSPITRITCAHTIVERFDMDAWIPF